MASKTHCMYCNSTSYGRPCIYSPTKVHVHMGDSTKCIYCGSKYRGSGCIYNPYNKFHTMGVDYSGQIKEQVSKSVVCSYLLNKMTDDVVEESVSSPLNRFYHRVASLLSHTGQPFTDALCLDDRNIKAQLTKEQVIEAFELKKLLESKLAEIHEILSKVNQSLPVEVVEESLIEAILTP